MSIWLQSDLPESTQVVVIGGGIAGVSVAYHLAKEGVEVVLFEAEEIAGRASGRNDGQVLLGIGEHYNRVVSQFGESDALRLGGFIRDNNRILKEQIVDSYTPSEEWKHSARHGLHMAESEQELEELKLSAALLYQTGVDCRMLNKEELAEFLPVEGFHGALYMSDETVVHPAELTRQIANRAQEFGAMIYPRHKVGDVQSADEGYVVQLTDGREIKTLMVVHCTSALAVGLDRSGFLESQIFPYRGQIIATDELDEKIIAPFAGRAMSSNFGYEYFRAYQRRFVIGGMRWSVKGQEEHTIDDTVINHVITDNLLDYVDKHFPTLRGVAFPHAWTGIMAGTNDGLPLVGEIPGQSGMFALLAFNGYGLSFAFKAGELISDQIIHGSSGHPAAPMFSPRRFK
jgi:glycine/D-amino acid oxidase-like deaminating enzyme